MQVSQNKRKEGWEIFFENRFGLKDGASKILRNEPILTVLLSFLY